MRVIGGSLDRTYLVNTAALPELTYLPPKPRNFWPPFIEVSEDEDNKRREHYRRWTYYGYGKPLTFWVYDKCDADYRNRWAWFWSRHACEIERQIGRA